MDSGFFAHEFEFEGRMVDVVPRTRVAQHDGAVVLFPGGGYGGYVWNWPAEYEQARDCPMKCVSGGLGCDVRGCRAFDL